MKKAGLLPLVAWGLVPACPAAEEPVAPRLSEHIRQEIRVSLPVYSPPPAPPDAAAATDAGQPTDPNTLVLPRMLVQEKRQQKLDPMDLLTAKERNKKFARDYRKSLTGLNAVLNGFSIPLVSPPAAALGRAMRDFERLQDFDHLVQVGKLTDPKAATALEKTVINMELADERQNRPAGGK